VIPEELNNPEFVVVVVPGLFCDGTCDWAVGLVVVVVVVVVGKPNAAGGRDCV